MKTRSLIVAFGMMLCTSLLAQPLKTKNIDNGGTGMAYNQLTFDMIYPVELETMGLKAKVFAKQAETADVKAVTIIDKEGILESTTLEDGWKKATVTVKFSPNEAKLTELTLGVVGVNTSFKGNV